MTMPVSVVQEHDRLPRRTALAVIGLSVLVGAVAVVASVLLAGPRTAPRAVGVPAPSATTMPEQTLIERTARGLRLREAQRAELDEYGWVDRDAGIVRIPVERAIELKAEPAD